MKTFEVRELKQNASELVRRAQAGEHITISIAGRPAALLTPLHSKTWRTWEEIADIWNKKQTQNGPLTEISS